MRLERRKSHRHHQVPANHWAGRAGVTLTSGRLFTCPREVPTQNVLTKTSIYFSAFPSGNHTSFTTNFHSFPTTVPLAVRKAWLLSRRPVRARRFGSPAGSPAPQLRPVTLSVKWEFPGCFSSLVCRGEGRWGCLVRLSTNAVFNHSFWALQTSCCWWSRGLGKWGGHCLC